MREPEGSLFRMENGDDGLRPQGLPAIGTAAINDEEKEA